MTPLQTLHDAIRAAAVAVAGDAGVGLEAVKLEIPPRAELGDYSTNAPLLLAPRLGRAPREVAGLLAGELAASLGGALERSEVAGPGFLNLHLRDGWYTQALAWVLAEGERFGSATLDQPLSVDVEFVSANPTGPLHIGHARQAAYGDALARILAYRGYEVTREYYINDYGSQVIKLGESVRALANGERVPGGRLPRRLRGRPRRTGAGARAGSRDARLGGLPGLPDADPGLTRTLRRQLRRLVLGALAARGGSGRARARDARRPRGDLHRRRRRCGCARAATGTTRTASWCAPAASTPTSPPTSPTSRTSANEDMAGSSTSGAPTTTATSRG